MISGESFSGSIVTNIACLSEKSKSFCSKVVYKFLINDIAIGHSSGQRVNPKYIKVHLPIRSSWLMVLLFAVTKVKSEKALDSGNR